MRTAQAIVAILCILLLSSWQAAVAVENAEKEIKSVLDQYVSSVEKEDMGQYAKIVAHDSTSANFGSMGGPIVGWEALRQVMEGQNASLDSIRIEQSDVVIHILPGGTSAWATSLWRFRAKAGQTLLDLPVRCTWILEKREGKWLIIHFHKSVAAG
ncbi:MAG: nuclear transport factor 2 family protein [bacterium]